MTINSSDPKARKGTKFKDRVDMVFSDPMISASDYLQTLRGNWFQLETDIKQSALFLLIFVAIFEFLTRAKVAEVYLAGFKISDVSLIHRIIPVVVAYYCHNMIYQGALRKKYEILHKTIVKKVYPKVYEARLESYLTPKYGSLTDDSFLAPPNSLSRTILVVLSSITVIVLFMSLIAFQFYAFNRLFVAFGYADFIVWISLGISVVFILRAVALAEVPIDE